MRRYENINGEKPIIEVKEHHVPGSTHVILTFKNGYGASIIPEYRYVGHKQKNHIIPGRYEVAVFYDGKLCYDTPITNDTLRSMNDPEVQDIVSKIQRLERMDIHYLHPEDH
jgi:hypothetical protein